MANSSPTLMLADSGFTGDAIVGEESLKHFRTHAFPSKPQGGDRRRYVFGRGAPVEPIKQVNLCVENKFCVFDVLPGKIGAV